MNNEITYEKALARLDEIVSALEKNELPLDEALAQFEEGTKLIAFCSDKLENAKQIIKTAEK